MRAVKADESTASAPDTDPTRSVRIKPLGLLATFVVALIGFAGVAAFFMSQDYTSPNYPNGVQVAKSMGTEVVNGQSVPHVSLAFDTYPDSTGTVNGKPIHPSGNPGWPAYGMSNDYQVPAHSLVTVTVRQYDSGEPLNNPWFANVVGTVDGTATVDGQTVTHIDPNAVGHTFTMRSVPGVDANFFLNIPLPAVAGEDQSDDGEYHTVTFSFMAGNAGTYAWNCEFPCGNMVAGFGGVMGAYGFMAGFFHVV